MDPQQQQLAAYDPSQVQAYEQSYYTYPYQYDQQNTTQTQYPYYPSDYIHIYQHQHEPTPIHPPGVPVPPETTTHFAANGYAQTHLQNQQNSYHPPPILDQQQQQQQQWQGNYGGFVPGSVHDGLGSIRPPIGQPPYRGRGRRGGRPSRGGGRGQSGFRPDGSAPTFHDGQVGGQHFAPHVGASTTPGSAFMPAYDPTTWTQGGTPQALMPPQSTLGPGQAPHSAQATPFWPPSRMAWCELCRVDCNTLEILEQHKNGKKHKKNLQRYEELQNLNKLITGFQSQQMPISLSTPEAVMRTEKVEGFEGKQLPPENLLSEAVGENNGVVADQQNNLMEKSEVSVVGPSETEKRSRMDHSEARGHGFKGRMRGGQGGGKRLRTTGWPRKPTEPPKPKQAIPLVCELCSVKCDSQVVFESHLAGKKHLSNLKRFHGYQAILGAAVLQALCPTNPNVLSSLLAPQLHQQGVHGTQGTSSQPVPYMLPEALAPATENALALAPAPAPIVETHDQLDSKPQVSQSIQEAQSQNSITMETKSQPQAVKTEVEAPLAASSITKTDNGIS